MPESAATKTSIRVLVVSYISAFIVLVMLLLSAQFLIQYTLFGETSQRTTAETLATQELRALAIQRTTILLITPGDHTTDYHNLETLDRNWEQTQVLIMRGELGLTAAEQAKVVGEEPDYQAVSAAVHTILALERAPVCPVPKSGVKLTPACRTFLTKVADQITIVFYRTQPYLVVLQTIRTTYDVEADIQVSLVQILEISLFTLSLGTLLFEALFVVRPAVRHLRAHLHLLAATLEQQKHKDAEATTIAKMVEASADAMLISNQAGRILYANSLAATLLGYPTLVGKDVEELLPQALRQVHAEHRADYLAHPRIRQMGEGMRLLALDAKGQMVPIKASLSPITIRDELCAIVAVRPRDGEAPAVEKKP